jgi:hypothetical protein
MEVQEQQSQKTLVSFISGLLIGGLLMWVFSAEPKKTQTTAKKETTTAAEIADKAKDVAKDAKATITETASDVADDAKSAMDTITDKTPVVTMEKPEVVTGAGSIAVSNQKAGKVVTLGQISYPNNGGWVAVHSMSGDALGPTLGAARYDIKAGLVPKNVELITPTTAGKDYRVVFHSTDGNRTYTSKTDLPLKGSDGALIGSTFKAE